LKLKSFEILTYDEQLARLTHAARMALRQYDLSEPQVEPIMYVNNAVFTVHAGDQKYALRLHRQGLKRREWIESEMRWLDAIRWETSLCVPRPVRTHEESLISQVEVEGIDEPLNCTLLAWIDGVFYKTSQLNLEQIRRLGAFLATLHHYSMKFQQQDEFHLPRLDWEGLFGENSPYYAGDNEKFFTPEQITIFDSVAARVRDVIEKLGETSENFGLIHADFIAKNYLFDGDTVCAIDFDDCAFGYYLYDLAPPLLQFSIEPGYPAMKAALWEGYTAVRPQPEQYRDYLETFVAARHVASCRWIVGNLHNPSVRERAPEIIRDRVEELRRFLDTGRLERKSVML
jgi:Ser/Thr protein kinase RdoA (MazF antagonist)